MITYTDYNLHGLTVSSHGGCDGKLTLALTLTLILNLTLIGGYDGQPYPHPNRDPNRDPNPNPNLTSHRRLPWPTLLSTGMGIKGVGLH